MINEEKWISSIPNNKNNEGLAQLDPTRWTSTISKKDTCVSTTRYGSITKYTFVVILFVSGLLLVSAVKNETRNLQKEIRNLRTSINSINFNLDQTILDNEVITSPENISKLAKEYLDTDFASYKKSQIKKLSKENETVVKLNTSSTKKKSKEFITTIKSHVGKEIETKKAELRKLQELYSKPESIPGEVKIQVAKKIEKTRTELKTLYSAPKDMFTIEKNSKMGCNSNS